MKHSTEQAQALTGKEGLFFGKELSEQERISIGTSAMAPYLGQGIANGFTNAYHSIKEDGFSGIDDAMEDIGTGLVDAGKDYVGDLYSGSKLVINAPLYGINYLRDAYELHQSYKDYNNNNMLPQNRLKDMDIRDIIRLKDKVEKDNNPDNDTGLDNVRDEIAERNTNNDLSKNITALERLQGLGQLDESQEKMLEALKGERGERVEVAKQKLHVTLASATEQIPSLDYDLAMEGLSEMIQLGVKVEKNANGLELLLPEMTTTGQSTTKCIGHITPAEAEKMLDSLKKDFFTLADMGISLLSLIPSPIRLVGDGYDIVTAIKGEGLAGELSPIERLAIAMPLIGSVHIKVIKNVGENGRVWLKEIGNLGETITGKWDKATFDKVENSMLHHVAKHGKGRTLEQYTDDAMKFFGNNKHLGERIILKDGTPGIKIQTGTGKNKIGGYWTTEGKLVTFWD